MLLDAYTIIRRPIMTEKANSDMSELNAYHFEVAQSANKIEIKKAIEEIYADKGITVDKVRIINKAPKKRRFHFRQGHTRTWKKAIVFLDNEHKLELF